MVMTAVAKVVTATAVVLPVRALAPLVAYLTIKALSPYAWHVPSMLSVSVFPSIAELQVVRLESLVIDIMFGVTDVSTEMRCA